METSFKSITILAFLLMFCGCAPLVKTDLKTFSEHPEQFKGKIIVFTTDLKSVVENPEAYLKKKIELTGYVTQTGFRRSADWDFILTDEEGRSVRCYEWEYRIRSWSMPERALLRAAKKREPVIVVGKLGKRLTIELDWIEYEGQHYDTDYKPPRVPFPLFP